MHNITLLQGSNGSANSMRLCGNSKLRWLFRTFVFCTPRKNEKYFNYLWPLKTVLLSLATYIPNIKVVAPKYSSLRSQRLIGYSQIPFLRFIHVPAKTTITAIKSV